MFEKKYIPAVNYDSMYGPEILRSLERIEELNAEDNKIERESGFKILSWESDISSAKREIHLMKGEVSVIKDKLSEIKSRFTSVVNELRMTSTSEDFERLKKRIDDFSFEKFMPREDFKALISKK